MIELWKTAIKTRDVGFLDEILADDAVLHSPVVHRPIEGKDWCKLYLQAAFSVFLTPEFNYRREIIQEKTAVLEFDLTIEGIYINGVDMIEWNDEGKITDFKVMIRPLKAIQKIHQKMAELIEKANANA